MQTGVECEYRLNLTCYVVVNENVDSEAYAKRIGEFLKEGYEEFGKDVQGEINVKLTTDDGYEDDRGGKLLTLNVQYVLIDYPDYDEGCEGDRDCPSSPAHFDYMDGEKTIHSMIETVRSAFEKISREEFGSGKNYLFDYEETYEYDTEENLFDKLEYLEEVRSECFLDEREEELRHNSIHGYDYDR
jgi:hypothetical protein